MNLLGGAIAGMALAVLQLPADVGQVPENEYVNSREFVSPVTGERFTALVSDGNPVVTDYDYDRCPHLAFNILAYTTVIDPASGYVNYPASFGASRWTEAELRDILGEPRFNRSAPPGLPWLGAYPWEKLENAAKLAEARVADPLEIANWWLMAGWSVRLDTASDDGEYSPLVSDLTNRMPRLAPDLTDPDLLRDLQLAQYWAQQHSAGQIENVNPADSALAIAWKYRIRGELHGASHWLEVSAGLSEDDRNGLVRHYLETSIELERFYLGQAGNWFVEAWEAGNLSQMEAGPIAFLIGEIQRRLGSLEESTQWYDLAIERNYGGMSQRLILRQRSVAANGQGY